jgi:hypothetical protein
MAEREYKILANHNDLEGHSISIFTSDNDYTILNGDTRSPFDEEVGYGSIEFYRTSWSDLGQYLRKFINEDLFKGNNSSSEMIWGETFRSLAKNPYELSFDSNGLWIKNITASSAFYDNKIWLSKTNFQFLLDYFFPYRELYPQPNITPLSTTLYKERFHIGKL